MNYTEDNIKIHQRRCEIWINVHSRRDTMYSKGYICLQLSTAEVRLQGHFDALAEVLPNENNRRLINEISNRLVTVFKEMINIPDIDYTNFMK